MKSIKMDSLYRGGGRTYSTQSLRHLYGVTYTGLRQLYADSKEESVWDAILRMLSSSPTETLWGRQRSIRRL